MSESEHPVTENAEASRFEVHVDGELAGFVDYVRSEGQLDLVHTEVFDGVEGRGVGSALVRGALDAIRAEGLLVVPSCPFVRSYVERHPEYGDLLVPGR